jgi:hypothetical protein
MWFMRNQSTITKILKGYHESIRHTKKGWSRNFNNNGR